MFTLIKDNKTKIYRSIIDKIIILTITNYINYSNKNNHIFLNVTFLLQFIDKNNKKERNNNPVLSIVHPPSSILFFRSYSLVLFFPTTTTMFFIRAARPYTI